MSYLLPHLHSGWAVDQAILGEEDRVVVIRFGHDWDPQCMQVRHASTSPLERLCVLCLVAKEERSSLVLLHGRHALVLHHS